MTSRNEQLYLRWFVQNHFKGTGALVELGCWMGSLTRVTCDGFNANADLDIQQLDYHVYDQFAWLSYMEDTVTKLNLPFPRKLEIGEDFLPLFKHYNADITHLFTTHKADLTKEQWTGGPIELLIIDAMKDESLCNNISSRFFPALVPGTSYILQQDFMHFYESWIHVSCYRLRDYIKPVFVVPDSGSLILKVCDSPPAETLAFESSMADISAEEIEATYKWAFGLVEKKAKNVIAAAHTMAWFHRGDVDRATGLYADYTKQYPRESSLTPHFYQFEHLRDYVIKFGFVDDLPPV